MPKDEEFGEHSIKLLLKRKDKVEAMKWLEGAAKGVSRNIGEMPVKESIQYVRELYRMGAREVVVVDIGVNQNYESTDTLVVTLPDDRAARRAIFTSENARAKEMGYDGDPDVGQRHLLCWFD